MRIALTVEVDPDEWRIEHGPCEDVRTAVEIYLLDQIGDSVPFQSFSPVRVVRLSGKPV